MNKIILAVMCVFCVAFVSQVATSAVMKQNCAGGCGCGKKTK